MLLSHRQGRQKVSANWLPSLLISFVLLAPSLALAASVPVTLAPLAQVAIANQQHLPATVVNEHQVVLRNQISGELVQRAVSVGDLVNQGDSLMQFDCTDYELARDVTQLQLQKLTYQQQLADRELKRAKALRSTRTVSEQTLDSAQTNDKVLRVERSVLEIQLKQQERQVARCEVKAPFAGQVVQLAATSGDWLAAGSALLTLVDLSASELQLALPLGRQSSLASATELTFEFAGQRYPAQLRAELQTLNATQQQTYRLRFLGTARPPVGAYGELSWASAGYRVPAHLVVDRDGVLGVFVAQTQQAKFIALPEAVAGASVELALPADTQLVVKGHHRLQDGDNLELNQP